MLGFCGEIRKTMHRNLDKIGVSLFALKKLKDVVDNFCRSALRACYALLFYNIPIFVIAGEAANSQVKEQQEQIIIKGSCYGSKFDHVDFTTDS